MAAKDKIAVVSGAGWMCHFVGELVDGLIAKGHTPEEIHTLVTPRGKPAMEKIVEEVSRHLRLITIPVWKVIKIGGFSTKDGLYNALYRKGCIVSAKAREIMYGSAFKVQAEPHEVRFAKRKVEDLGFTDMPTTTELFARIKEVGKLCELEDGPYLGIADEDQVKHKRCFMAMEPIVESHNLSSIIFCLEYCDGRKQLSVYYTRSDVRWHLEIEFYFRLRG